MAFNTCQLLASTLTNLQLFQAIKTLYTLVVHQLTLMSKLQVNHANSIAPMPLGELNNPLTKLPVTILSRLISKRATAHADHF